MVISETQHQEWMKGWLCDAIGLTPTPDMVCIGNHLNGKLKGVVGYDNYNGASVMMHVAGEGNWFTKDMLFASFHYPFHVMNVNMVIGLVPSGNTDALRFNNHIGFKVAHRLHGAHPDGALVLMTMERRECRFLTRPFRLKEKTHGQEEQAAAST